MQRHEFSDGNIDEILTEADKSRVFFALLEQLDFENFKLTLDATKSLGDERKVVEKETVMDYLKRTNVVKEINPLWSKANAIRAWRENRQITEPSDLLKQCKEKTRMWIDNKLIRDHYGDEVAIYYEWMASFEKHIRIPGIASIFVFIGNNTLYTS